jgi:hypothetical protein
MSKGWWAFRRAALTRGMVRHKDGAAEGLLLSPLTCHPILWFRGLITP